MPASASISSSNLPAGPTNGFPWRSSWSPGCSPISMMGEFDAPSPKTACVAFFQRSQLRQSCAAFASCRRLRESAGSSAEIGGSFLRTMRSMMHKNPEGSDVAVAKHKKYRGICRVIRRAYGLLWIVFRCWSYAVFRQLSPGENCARSN